jgi:hypothetical protein
MWCRGRAGGDLRGMAPAAQRIRRARRASPLPRVHRPNPRRTRGQAPMIRLTWILAVLVLAAVSGHFGYLHLVAAPTPARTPSPASELSWLQRELDLTPSQLTTVRSLHEECWTRVASLRAELEAEQRNARATGNPTACMVMEEQCKKSTVTFIAQMSTVLTPAQRQKYLGLVAPCLPPPATRAEGGNVEQSSGR